MKFYFLRHAADIPDVIGGWYDNPLSSEGKRQIKRLVEYFDINGKNFNIKYIVSSSLSRAILTVSPIAKIYKLNFEKSEKWNGLNQGNLNGLSSKIAKEKYPTFELTKVPSYLPFPGGESIQYFTERVKKSFNELCQFFCNKEGDVLICTHGANMCVLYASLMGEKWKYKKLENFIPCTLMIVDTETKKISCIDTINFNRK